MQSYATTGYWDENEEKQPAACTSWKQEVLGVMIKYAAPRLMLKWCLLEMASQAAASGSLSVHHTQIIHSSFAISPFTGRKDEWHINHRSPNAKWFDQALYLHLIFTHSISFIPSSFCSPTVNAIILFVQDWKSTFAQGGRWLQNLIWLDDSILRGHRIGMQSTGLIQPHAQKQPFFPSSRLPDLATSLHNPLNYSRLEEGTNSLTSAPMHVKQAL